jgi:hypothetical protein
MGYVFIPHDITDLNTHVKNAVSRQTSVLVGVAVARNSLPCGKITLKTYLRTENCCEMTSNIRKPMLLFPERREFWAES